MLNTRLVFRRILGGRKGGEVLSGAGRAVQQQEDGGRQDQQQQQLTFQMRKFHKSRIVKRSRSGETCNNEDTVGRELNSRH